MKTAIVTGVTGQDGRYLTRALVARGFRVVGTTRGEADAALALVRPFGGNAVEVVPLDLADADAVARVVASVAPQHVYHLAGQTSVGRSLIDPAGTFQSLALTTLTLLEAVRLHSPSTRVLLAGSGEAFGDTGGVPADEATAASPRSPYAAAKAAVRHLGASYRVSYGLFVCTAIFYNHESPLRSPAFFTRKVVRSALEVARGARQRVPLGALEVIRDFGWAEEYVEASCRMLELPSPEDFVLATGESHALRDFVQLVFARVGLDYEKHVDLDPGLLRSSEIPVMSANPEKAGRLLSWRANVRFGELVDRLIAEERRVEATHA